MLCLKICRIVSSSRVQFNTWVNHRVTIISPIFQVLGLDSIWVEFFPVFHLMAAATFATIRVSNTKASFWKEHVKLGYHHQQNYLPAVEASRQVLIWYGS